MKILSKDLRHGLVKVQVDSLDDLWYLSHVIDVNDHVSGKTLRKIKIGEEPNIKVVRKPVFLKIKVEKVDFVPETSSLRVLGTVTEGPEDVSKGSHHSFGFELNDSFTIFKSQWLRFQLDKLEEAAKPKSNVLILVLDRDSASFALLKGSGYSLLSSLSGDVAKKDVEQQVKGNFFDAVAKSLGQYVDRYSPGSIVVGSPGFWKQEFSKSLSDELKEKIVFATCSSVGESGINELLKRDEVKSALKQDRITKEISAIESLLAEIHKEGNVVYGLKETELAAESGAVERLFVSDGFLQALRQGEEYAKIDSLMRLVERTKGGILIISSDHEGGRKLDGLGGVAALLRFKIS
jgi:protein pelota